VAEKAGDQLASDYFVEASKHFSESLLIEGPKRAENMVKVINSLKFIPYFDTSSNVSKLPFYSLSSLANCFMSKWGEAKNLHEKALKISPDDYLVTITSAILAYRELASNLLPSKAQKLAPVTASLAAVNAFQLKYRGATPTSPNVNRDRYLMTCLAMMAENYYGDDNKKSVLFYLIYTPFGSNEKMTREEIISLLQSVQGLKTVLETIKSELQTPASPDKKSN